MKEGVDFNTLKGFKALELPLSLRESLQIPIGNLVEPIDGGSSPQEQLKPYLESYKGFLVTVGDVVTDSLYQVQVYPDISIIDIHTLRDDYRAPLITSKNIFHCKNTPATISLEAWTLIRKLFELLKTSRTNQKLASVNHTNKDNSLIIEVKGEEDLLTIPCVLEAPVNSLVLYGQPKKGIVVVNVTFDLKKHLFELIEKFTIIS